MDLNDAIGKAGKEESATRSAAIRPAARGAGPLAGALRSVAPGSGAGPDASRVLQFASHFHIGGTERHVLNLVGGLDRARFDLHIGCFARQGQLFPQLEASGVPISEYRIHSLYNPRSLRARLEFGRYLRRHSIDIVHSYGFYSNVFALPAAQLAGVPVTIASIRDTGEMLSGMKKRVQKLFCRRADCILANADGVRSWLIAEGYPAEKIQVIRNGIALPPARRRGPSAFRQELGLDPGVPVIAVVSRLVRVKGVEHFLEAAAKVSVLFPRARFLVVGGGPHQAALERYSAQLGLHGRVTFTGFRGDVYEVLAGIDVYVLPSLSEGLSNSLLESMAAGVPTIATRVGGTPEALEDGQSGLLVRPGDCDALARAMCLLLRNPELAAAFGRAGRCRVEAAFTIEKMVRQTESLYLRLLEQKGRTRREARVA